MSSLWAQQVGSLLCVPNTLSAGLMQSRAHSSLWAPKLAPLPTGVLSACLSNILFHVRLTDDQSASDNGGADGNLLDVLAERKEPGRWGGGACGGGQRREGVTGDEVRGAPGHVGPPGILFCGDEASPSCKYGGERRVGVCRMYRKVSRLGLSLREPHLSC